MSTQPEKLNFILTSLARAAAELVSSQTVVKEALLAEQGGGPVAPVPAVPAGYTATLGADKRSVVLTWVDPPENGDAYQLEGLPALGADQSTYVVSGLAQNTIYTAPQLRRLGVDANSEWVTAEPPAVEIPASQIVIPPPEPGKYPGPPQGAKSVSFDVDVTRLSPGIYAMSSGVRAKPLTGLKTGVQIWCQNQYGVEYSQPGLAFNTVGNILSGFRFRGIGQKPKRPNSPLNDEAGGFVGDDSQLLWSEFLEAIGVGAAFGFLSDGKVASGKNVKCLYNRFINCGSSGFGGKGRTAEVAYNYFEGNNKRVGDTDGAGAGKYTRSEDMDFHHNTIINATGTGVWWDIENKRIRVYENIIDGVLKLKENYRRRGVVFEWSMEGPFVVRGNTFRNCAVPVALEETGGDVVTGTELKLNQLIDNTFYAVEDGTPEACEIHLRDDWKGRGNYTPEKRLKHWSIAGNKRADGKPLRLARSNSGDKFTKAELTGEMGFEIADKFTSVNF